MLLPSCDVLSLFGNAEKDSLSSTQNGKEMRL